MRTYSYVVASTHCYIDKKHNWIFRRSKLHDIKNLRFAVVTEIISSHYSNNEYTHAIFNYYR
ncbi:hypothetical protein D3C87_280890 [compost metagenome]